MEYGAIDLHLRRSQVRIIDEQEQVVLDRRVDTTRGEFDRLLAGRARMRILIESSTESEWVAQHLEGLGTRRWWSIRRTRPCTGPDRGR
jgi:hypothetical protein